MPETATITDFLLARIAHDERYVEGGWADLDRMDTNRLLAECEAKRRIIAAVADWTSGGVWASWADDILCALAEIYADHPDYDEEWKP